MCDTVMAEAPPPPQAQPVDIDPDFEPLSRPRSCTWPLPRPEVLVDPAGSNTSSPAPQPQEPGGTSEFIGSLGLLEEDYEEYEEPNAAVELHRGDGNRVQLHHHHPHQQQQQHHHHHHHHHLQQQQVAPPPPPSPPLPPPPPLPLGGSAGRKSGGHSSSRRNAWGNLSYADLITKAIDSAPEKRLTLSQIYDWMVRSVPYFKDKGDSNSSAGWKNSIRHNLSLHSRFVRVQNEGTGKSSWWMLNPEGGKNGKSPRRRAASMDNNSKLAKSRGRATKKKLALQEGPEGGATSPGPQYPNWLGSPNSHSNEDFEPWGSFRTRTSSDASTLSGHRSPFPSEQDDLGEADAHMMYPGSGAPGSKMASTLPSLSEVTGSHGSEMVMESLVDNLNLLSPENSPLGLDPPRSSNAAAMLQGPYGSPGLTQQDYRKCMYAQAGMNPLPPPVAQMLPEAKSGFGPYENQYLCPAGLLKELLTSERDMMSSRDTASQGGRGRCALPAYGGGHVGGHGGVKMLSLPQRRPVPHSSCSTPPAIHNRAPSTSRDLNARNMIPLTALTCPSGAPPRLTDLRTCPQQPPPPPHRPPADNVFSRSYLHHHHHLHHPHGLHHQERLPSDLDNMSIERLECDMESVLHDTLMDGGALDFNFDPAAGPHGFPQRVKPTTHSWVSG